MDWKIKLYKNKKLYYILNVWMSKDSLLKQLKNGILFYHTNYNYGDTELYYLNQYDKIIINDISLFDFLMQEFEIKEKEKEYEIIEVIDLLNRIANKEKIPKKIEFEGKIYYYDSTQDYYNYYVYLFEDVLSSKQKIYNILHKKIKIIEEN